MPPPPPTTHARRMCHTSMQKQQDAPPAGQPSAPFGGFGIGIASHVQWTPRFTSAALPCPSYLACLQVDPLDDIDVISLELALCDLGQIEKRMERLKKGGYAMLNTMHAGAGR